MFEVDRKRKADENKLKAIEKEEQIKRVAEENKNIIENKRLKFLKSMQETEERMKIMEEREKLEQREKKKKEEENDQYRKEILKINYQKDSEKRDKIREKLVEDDEKVRKIQNENNYAMKQKAQIRSLKREDRHENVKRINKQQEYEREQVLDKILMKQERVDLLMKQKQDIIESKRQISTAISNRKREAMEMIEKMQRKGNIDEKKLLKFGIDPNYIKSIHESTSYAPVRSSLKNFKSEPINFGSSNSKKIKTVNFEENKFMNFHKEFNEKTESAAKKFTKNFSNENQGQSKLKTSKVSKEAAKQIISEKRAHLHRELLNVLESEQGKESEREQIFKNATENEKVRLDKIFGIERAKASDKITKLSEKQNQELDSLIKKYGVSDI